MKKILAAFAAATATVVLPAWAEVSVREPWVRGTMPAQKSTGAFMEIVSDENAAAVSASSPVARLVEIHSMSIENGIMRMRRLNQLELPAGKPVKLGPSGAHIMLIDLRQQLKPGDIVPIALKVVDAHGKARLVEVNAPVRDLATPSRRD
jgi:copper(I)-binding protein